MRTLEDRGKVYRVSGLGAQGLQYLWVQGLRVLWLGAQGLEGLGFRGFRSRRQAAGVLRIHLQAEIPKP